MPSKENHHGTEDYPSTQASISFRPSSHSMSFFFFFLIATHTTGVVVVVVVMWYIDSFPSSRAIVTLGHPASPARGPRGREGGRKRITRIPPLIDAPSTGNWKELSFQGFLNPGPVRHTEHCCAAAQLQARPLSSPKPNTTANVQAALDFEPFPFHGTPSKVRPSGAHTEGAQLAHLAWGEHENQ